MGTAPLPESDPGAGGTDGDNEAGGAITSTLELGATRHRTG